MYFFRVTVAHKTGSLNPRSTGGIATHRYVAAETYGLAVAEIEAQEGVSPASGRRPKFGRGTVRVQVEEISEAQYVRATGRGGRGR